MGRDVTIVRLSGWPERLLAHVDDAARRPFAWGTHDCGLFADGAIAALTGARLFADLWMGYDSAWGALRALRRAGFGSTGGALDARLPRRAVLAARRGDIVALGEGRLPPLGVVTGRTAAALTPRGTLAVPLEQARAAWGVG